MVGFHRRIKKNHSVASEGVDTTMVGTFIDHHCPSSVSCHRASGRCPQTCSTLAKDHTGKLRRSFTPRLCPTRTPTRSSSHWSAGWGRSVQRPVRVPASGTCTTPTAPQPRGSAVSEPASGSFHHTNALLGYCKRVCCGEGTGVCRTASTYTEERGKERVGREGDRARRRKEGREGERARGRKGGRRGRASEREDRRKGGRQGEKG